MTSKTYGFPYVPDGMEPRDYLLRLLLALIRKQGGKVKLKATEIQSLPSGAALSKTCDFKKGEIQLEFTETNSELFFVEEARCQKQNEIASTPQTRKGARVGMTTPLQPQRPIPPVSVDETTGEYTEQEETEEEMIRKLRPELARKTVLDDVSLFLKEQRFAQRIQNQREQERLQGIREGMQPWRTVKTVRNR